MRGITRARANGLHYAASTIDLDPHLHTDDRKNRLDLANTHVNARTALAYVPAQRQRVAALRSQIVISKRRSRRTVDMRPMSLPNRALRCYQSTHAIAVNIEIMRAFVRMRALLASSKELAQKLAELEHKLASHDQAIVGILKAIRELMHPPVPKQRPIGFTANLDE